MKFDKSLGGRIAYLEVPSSRKILIPPFQVKIKDHISQVEGEIGTVLGKNHPSLSELTAWGVQTLYLDVNKFLKQ